MMSSIQTNQTLAFVNTLFVSTDVVLIRPIESWTEAGRKKSRVLYKQVRHSTAGAIAECDLDQLNQLAEQTGANLFFGVCPRFAQGGYDLAWQIRTVRCVWADVDDCSPDEARERCTKAELPDPSIIVSSGNGVHLYWLLNEPYLIDDAGDPPQVKIDWTDIKGKRKPIHYFDDEHDDRVWLEDQKTGKPIAANRPKLSDKAQHVQDVVQGIAAKIGGDHTFDLARLLRLPGTMNRKDQRSGREPVPCEIVHLSDARYPFDQFAPLADASPDKHRREKVAQVRLKIPRPITPSKQDKLNVRINACMLTPMGERSEADYAYCCHCIEYGIAKDEAWSQVSGIGKFAERGAAYFDLTWGKAELHTREQIYEQAVRNAAEPSSNGRHSEETSDRPQSGGGIPDVTLPGGDVPITDAASKLGALLAVTGEFFRRGNAVVKLTEGDNGEPILWAVKPAMLPAAFEYVARLWITKDTKEGRITVPDTCNEQTAKLILHSDAFLDALPPIRLLSRCPVLVERDGELIQVCGYDRTSGVLAFGEPLPEVSINEAKELLTSTIADFQFATPSDQSRALAAIITPAMVHGGLLGGRAPVDLGEADQSQTGKGYRNKLTAAFYRQTVSTVTERKGGVGSLEETFNAKLVQGAGFISLDNVRGKVDSPAIESFLTEDRYSARVPYSPDVEIDPRRVVLMFTSNRAEITPDLAYRSSCVRLLKRDAGYEFASHPEGDLLDHIRANQPRYLAAVFAVISEWHRRGKRRTNETRHDFRQWAKTLDWIVQEILGEAPLLDGHTAARERMTSPALNWLRDVALVVSRAGRIGNWLRTHEILDLLENTDVAIPGVQEEADLNDDDVRSNILRALGRKLAKCFAGKAEMEIDAFTFEGEEGTDHEGRAKWHTRFTLHIPANSSDFPPNHTSKNAYSPNIPMIEQSDSFEKKCSDVLSKNYQTVRPMGGLGEDPGLLGEPAVDAEPEEAGQWTF